MPLIKLAGSAVAAVLAAAVLAPPATAAPSTPTRVSVASHSSDTGDAARHRRATLSAAVMLYDDPSAGPHYWQISAQLLRRGVPYAGKRVVIQVRSHGHWLRSRPKSASVARTDANGVVSFYGASRKAGQTYRLLFAGDRRTASAHSVRFSIDYRP